MSAVIGFLSVCLVTAFAEESAPPQFTLMDHETDWVRTTIVRNLNQPEDWSRDGFDYLGGEMYLRLEIFEKPTDEPIKVQFCVWHENSEICSPWPTEFLFSEPGVYYQKFAPYEDWHLRHPERAERRRFEGEGRLNRVVIQWWIQNPDPSAEKKFRVLRTKLHGGVVSGRKEAVGEFALQHIPIRYRQEVVVVAQGHRLVPPEHWEGHPSEW